MPTRPDFIIKEDSERPAYREQLRDINRDVIELDALDDVQFLMEIDETTMINSPATVVDPANGIVEYEFAPGETAIEDGQYQAEFRVDFNDGPTLFWPQRRTLVVEITTGVDREADPAVFDDPDASLTTLYVDTIRANSEEAVSIGDDVDFGGNDASNIGAMDAESASVENISTERQSDDWHFSGSYPGSDPDSRLDNAISASTNGDVIYLENTEYTNNRTFEANRRTYIGTRSQWSGGTEFSGTVTLNSELCTFKNIQLGDVTITDRVITILDSSNSDITVDADRILITHCHDSDVTFNSGTEDGLVDSSLRTSVTDNGNNVVGDMS